MDLTRLIKEKCKAFTNTEHYQGIECVMSHLVIAERHLQNGSKGDDYLFNDVVYRTNHAFECLLREAYSLLSEDKSHEKSSYEIEMYFEENKVLREKAHYLFTSYRQDWRNVSAYDCKIYYSEQEAFLAIISMATFFNVLLDQMIEAIADKQESHSVSKMNRELPESYASLEFVRQVCSLLVAFSKTVPARMQNLVTTQSVEREVSGMLAGFIKATDPDIDVLPEFAISMGSSRKLQADFVLKKGNESLIVEMKMPGTNIDRRRVDGRDRLLTYMTVSSLDNGILYIPPVTANQQMAIESQTREVASFRHNIVEVFPKTKNPQSSIALNGTSSSAAVGGSSTSGAPSAGTNGVSQESQDKES